MKVKTINRDIEAEQYLEDSTNWHSLHAIVPAGDVEEGYHPERDLRMLRITYDNRDYYLEFGDWVVRYPDGSLHFFDKRTFDELYTNPFTEPFGPDEISQLLEAAR